MRLDRSRQKQMLECLAACYPSFSSTVVASDDQDAIANLWYLREHELVEAFTDQSLFSGDFTCAGARITAKGLDFLADDGGLSAILGTVTVKLHGDTIRELLLVRIESSTLPPEEKSWLRKQIEAMSSEALQTVAKSLVEQGLQRVPDLMQWAKSMLELNLVS